MFELVWGMKVHRPGGFIPNGRLPRTPLRSTYESVAPAVNKMLGALDNTATDHTPMVRGTVHNVFDGIYFYAAPYGMYFKPVERLFIEVIDILRDIEDEAVLNPIRTIYQESEIWDGEEAL